jgi:hypothetical protein
MPRSHTPSLIHDSFSHPRPLTSWESKCRSPSTRAEVSLTTAKASTSMPSRSSPKASRPLNSPAATSHAHTVSLLHRRVAWWRTAGLHAVSGGCGGSAGRLGSGLHCFCLVNRCSLKMWHSTHGVSVQHRVGAVGPVRQCRRWLRAQTRLEHCLTPQMNTCRTNN